MEYDHNLSLKENYMRFYQDCLRSVGIKNNAARLACAAYVELSPDDELEKQRIYLRDNGIKHCKWVLAQWDRVFLHWKDTGSLTGIITVMNDTKHKIRRIGYYESFVKDDEDPTVIGYEYDPEAVLLYRYTIDATPVIEPKDETQPQPTQPSVTEATQTEIQQSENTPEEPTRLPVDMSDDSDDDGNMPQPTQPSVTEVAQPETQQPENTSEEPTSLPIEMCDELRQYIEAKGTAGVYNKGPKNPLYNIVLARQLMNDVFTGNDAISSYDRFMSSVY